MSDARRVVRPRAKSSAAKQMSKPEAVPVQDPWNGTLDEGDRIEFSITAEVKNRQGRSFWVKGGATVSVRPHESPGQAKQRVVSFAAALVDEQVQEYLS